MVPYFVMLCVPAMVATFNSLFKSKYKIKNANRLIVDAFFGIWIVMLVFRNSTLGVDLPVYKQHFFNYSSLTWKDIFSGIFTRKFEATYVLISKIIGMFTSDFHWIMVICALLSVLPIWILYRKETKHSFLTIVLFVNIAPFAVYFSGLRQGIAIAFAVPCYHYCKERKLTKFVITVIIAMITHSSAFILLAMYPIYHLRIKKQIYLFLIIPLIGVLYVFRLPVFQFLIKLLGNEYIERYSAGIKATGAYSVTLLLVLLLLFSYLVTDTQKLDKDTIGLRNILFFSVIIQIFSGVHTLAMRMNYYYLIFIPLLISKIIDRGQIKYRILLQLSLICMCCFFAFYFFYRIYTGTDDLGIYPYISIFSNY